ncbi:hypothetical protein L249_1179 [Ophiocordyceps polyrhachis-furcata BCC 54312]|uniref:Tf2-1-like SH3-like domain-containing protein n=1 Tax=Ophiocordyceps polyrhachis-furcata BCC 54312 TaxID=1330021 RepID=A0A367LFK9_9HYPO|nr:hypothetical protein L249_1179 [Ophiocordyceps polyrhachis-furcata BCC 54312]
MLLKTKRNIVADGRVAKLAKRQTGPFRVIKRVGHLAYRLDLDKSLNIHPVVSIIQLRPAEAPAKRLGPEPDTDNYKVDRILNIRKIKRGKGLARTEYLLVDDADGERLLDDYDSDSEDSKLLSDNDNMPTNPSSRRQTRRNFYGAYALLEVAKDYIKGLVLGEITQDLAELDKIKKVLDILSYWDCLSKMEKMALEAMEKETTTSNALPLFGRALARRSATSAPTPTLVLSTPERRRPAITPATPLH